MLSNTTAALRDAVWIVMAERTVQLQRLPFEPEGHRM